MMGVVVLYRDDLRLTDQPALEAACASGDRVIPLWVPPQPADQCVASDWWRIRSVQALARELAERGAPLWIRSGGWPETLDAIRQSCEIRAVYWTRRYAPKDLEADRELESMLRNLGIETQSFNGFLLHEPWEISTHQETPYRVFTPYWRAARTVATSPSLADPPGRIPGVVPPPGSDATQVDRLADSLPGWSRRFERYWQPGERGARTRLDAFLATGLSRYQAERDKPGADAVSRLSPHLRFGEISIREVAARVREQGACQPELSSTSAAFIRQLYWREFSYHLLHHFPQLSDVPLRPEFANLPWRDSREDFDRWCLGQTGYPFVDAGMRELWQTGWMHNRARLVVASFLVKDLLLPWQWGARWFLETLVDADPANNSASWQWVAGCGTDAAPYFRIFNPWLQGLRFDPNGNWIRRYVPELATLSDASLHTPIQPPGSVQESSDRGSYPLPMIAHESARARALAAFLKIHRHSAYNRVVQQSNPDDPY